MWGKVPTSCVGCNAEAQKKSLQKLTTQKSHSFTVGDSPLANSYFPARRFDDVLLEKPSAPKAAAAACHDDDHAVDLTRKLTQHPSGMLARDDSLGVVISPAISSSFGDLDLQKQLPGQLVQELGTRAVPGDAQTARGQDEEPGSFITADRHEFDERGGEAWADVSLQGLKEKARRAESKLSMEDLLTSKGRDTVGVGQEHGGDKKVKEDAVRDMETPCGERGTAYALGCCLALHLEAPVVTLKGRDFFCCYFLQPMPSCDCICWQPLSTLWHFCW